MNAQPSLFDAPITSGTHRKRERQTSVDAARSMSGPVLNKQQREALAVVAANPCEGATAYELATQLGFQQNVMARRLSDLGEMGYAFRRWGWIGEEQVYEARPGSSGRRCDVWRATDAGLEWLSGVVDVATASRL